MYYTRVWQRAQNSIIFIDLQPASQHAALTRFIVRLHHTSDIICVAATVFACVERDDDEDEE